jgi:hypothetical protein
MRVLEIVSYIGHVISSSNSSKSFVILSVSFFPFFLDGLDSGEESECFREDRFLDFLLRLVRSPSGRLAEEVSFRWWSAKV